MISKKWLLIFFFEIQSGFLFADTLKFKLENKTLKTFDSKEWKQNNFHSKSKTLLKPSEQKLYNVTTHKEVAYIGYNFQDLLNHVYGPQWKNYKRIIFKAKDGFVRASLVKVVSDAFEKGQTGLIAFKEKGKQGFSKIKKRKNLDPGDFYLVWTGYKKGDDLVENANNLIWPYQLKEIKVSN